MYLVLASLPAASGGDGSLSLWQAGGLAGSPLISLFPVFFRMCFCIRVRLAGSPCVCFISFYFWPFLCCDPVVNEGTHPTLRKKKKKKVCLNETKPTKIQKKKRNNQKNTSMLRIGSACAASAAPGPALSALGRSLVIRPVAAPRQAVAALAAASGESFCRLLLCLIFLFFSVGVSDRIITRRLAVLPVSRLCFAC